MLAIVIKVNTDARAVRTHSDAELLVDALNACISGVVDSLDPDARITTDGVQVNISDAGTGEPVVMLVATHIIG